MVADWHGLWSARVEHLIDGRHVGVMCFGCGHLAEIPVDAIKAKAHPNLRVQHLPLSMRCRSCKAKGQVRLVVGYALGRNLAPGTGVPF